MDYHKYLPTPKVSSEDSLYLRKLRTNLFGVYSANEDIKNYFFYDESTGGSGPNEVIEDSGVFSNSLTLRKKSKLLKNGQFLYEIAIYVTSEATG